MTKENVYMVVYDLLEPEQNAAALEKLLTAYRTKKQKLLSNAWLVKTAETEESLYRTLAPHLGADDRCVVILVSRSCWVARLPRILQKVTLWMSL